MKSPARRRSFAARPEPLESRIELATFTWTGRVDNFLSKAGNWSSSEQPTPPAHVIPKDGDELIFPADGNATHDLQNDLPDRNLLVSVLHLGGGYKISAFGGNGSRFTVGDIETVGDSGRANGGTNTLNLGIDLSDRSGPTGKNNHLIYGDAGLVFQEGIGQAVANQNVLITNPAYDSAPGPGLVYAGPSNSYNGTTTLVKGSLTLQTSAGPAVAGDLVLGGIDFYRDNPQAVVVLGAPGQLTSGSDVTMGWESIFNAGDFDTPIGSLDITSATLTSGKGTVTVNGNITATNAFRAGSDLRDQTVPAAIGGHLSLGGATRTVTLNVGPNAGPTSLLMNAAVSQSAGGAVGLTAVGNGGLIVGGDQPNTFAGPLTANAAVPVQLGKTSGPAAPGGLTIPFALSAILTAAEQIGDRATVNISGGFLNLNGFDEAVGDVSLYAAKIYTAGNGKGSTLTINGNLSAGRDATYGYSYISGTQTYSGSGPFRQGAVALSPGSHTFNIANPGTSGQFGDAVIYLPISGAGASVVKSGPGTLMYDVAAPSGNTYDGTTTVRGGILQLNSQGGHPSFGGDLVVNASGPAGAQVQWLQSNVLPAGKSVTVTSNTSILNLNGKFDETGSLSLASGRVITGAGNLFVDGDVMATGNVTYGGNLGLTPAANVHKIIVPNASDSFVVNGTVLGSSTKPDLFANLSKEGAGALQFTGAGANTYNGSTTVNGGTLRLNKWNGVSVPGALTINAGATVQFQRDKAINPAATVSVQGGVLDLFGRAQAIAGTLNIDAKGIVRTGAGTLNVSGKVAVGAGGGTISGNVGLNGTAVGIEVADGGTLSVPAAMARSAGLPAKQLAGLTKSGAGRLVLSGKSGFGGNTTVNAGTLQVTGSLANSTVVVNNDAVLGGSGIIGSLTANGGTISPGLGNPGKPGGTGAASILTVNKNATLGAASTLAFTLDGTVANPQAGRGADQLRVIGAVTLGQSDGHGPSLAGSLLNSTVPASATVYRVLSTTAISGTFDTVARPLGQTIVDVPGGSARIFIVRSRRGTGVVDLNFNS